MSRFVARRTERFDLGDGDWVELLVQLSYADRANIEQKLLAGSIEVQTQEPDSGPAKEMSGDAKERARAGVVDRPETEIAMAAANMELLKRTIVAWGGPGFTLEDGKVAPINEATIGTLDETAEKILNELQRRMVKPKQGFTSPPSPPTPMAGAEASTEVS